MKPIYLLSVVYLGSFNFQVRKTKPQRGKMTYAKPLRARIQVFWFLGQRTPTSFSLRAAVGLSKAVITVKIRLEGGRDGHK